MNPFLKSAVSVSQQVQARRAHFFLVKKMAFWGAFWGIFGAFGAKFENLAKPNLQILRVSVRSDGSVRTYGAVSSPGRRRQRSGGRGVPGGSVGLRGFPRPEEIFL